MSANMNKENYQQILKDSISKAVTKKLQREENKWLDGLVVRK